MFWKLLGDCCNGWVTNTFFCKLYSLTAKKRCVKEQQIASVTNKPTQEQLEGSTDAIVQHKPLRKAFKGGYNWTYTGLEKCCSLIFLHFSSPFPLKKKKNDLKCLLLKKSFRSQSNTSKREGPVSAFLGNVFVLQGEESRARSFNCLSPKHPSLNPVETWWPHPSRATEEKKKQQQDTDCKMQRGNPKARPEWGLKCRRRYGKSA